MQETFRFEIGEADAKQRLDKFLFSKIGAVSRLFTARKIKEGFCRVNGEIAPGGYKLKTNDAVEISLEISTATAMNAEEMTLKILFEDEEILVVNKPENMLVHPSRYVRSGTLLNGLLHKAQSPKDDAETRRHADAEINPQSAIRNPQSEIPRIGLPHRLDRETSGLMIVTKTERALRILSSHFERKLVEKTYLALVAGIPAEDFGEIHAPIGRIEDGIPRWQVSETGKPAETRFKVLERREDVSLLELKPITGRTNQLRIHCAHFGHAILGDVQRAGREFSRLCLHAHKIGFFHPNGGWLEFEKDVDFFAGEKDFVIQ